ncbi:hypothetical protein D3C75_1370260 [compost metagenome]
MFTKASCTLVDMSAAALRLTSTVRSKPVLMSSSDSLPWTPSLRISSALLPVAVAIAVTMVGMAS